MSVFPQLERELLEAARRRRLEARAGRGSSAPKAARRAVLGGRLPAALIGLACLLAATTVALAAGGVILTGAPVRPEEALNPNVGEGLPAQGESQLLALRVADPEGGLPWGMRLVRTTRGETCVQVGRMQGKELGALGIDGEFGDDGRFHPLPADALPADVFHGRAFDSTLGNAQTSCEPVGQAVVAYHFGLDRGAGPNLHGARKPLRELRDVYFGLLGPQAVSVTYKAGRHRRTVPVVPGVGAYLIVGRTHPGQQVESGGGSLGTEGDLAPSPPLVAITYRIGGRLCERVPSVAPWEAAPKVSDPCPWPRFANGQGTVRNLHRPVRLSLQVRGRSVTGASLSFTAPFAVTSAQEHYVVEVPSQPCEPVGRHGGVRTMAGGGLETTAANVTSGQRLTFTMSPAGLFSPQCPVLNGRDRRTGLRTLPRRSVEVEVFYEAEPGSRIEVGSVTAREPAGARP